MKHNYLEQLSYARRQSKFDTIYESIMGNLDLYKNVKAQPITNLDLNLLLEDINAPQYVICESSGDAILLEKAIFMEESFLISEGIFDTVTNKVKDIFEKLNKVFQKY